MSTAPTPKYLDDIDDVPASGPDPYSRRAKGRAIRYAEGQFESDVNNGNEFTADEIEPIHQEAIALLATHRLAIDPKAPDAATMGDLADEGAGRMDYAEKLYELYERAVDAISTAEGDAGEGGGGTVDEDGEFSPPTLSGGGHVHID